MALTAEAAAGARSRLEAELAHVERELAELGSGPDGSMEVKLDEGFADAGQATSERANVLSLVEGLQHRWEDIRSALGRVERGVYGACERCGRDIASERLEAVPTARLCIACANKR